MANRRSFTHALRFSVTHQSDSKVSVFVVIRGCVTALAQPTVCRCEYSLLYLE